MRSPGDLNGALSCSVIRADSAFCDGCLLVWWHLPECIHLWHTSLTIGIMVWGTLSYNTCLPLVFVEETLNSTLYIQYFFQFILLIFLLQQDNACPHDVMLLNMLCNMFNSFPGWYNSQSYFLLDIQVLLYCINRCKRHEIMYCKRVFIIHTIVWMQEYRLVIMPKKDIQWINIGCEYC